MISLRVLPYYKAESTGGGVALYLCNQVKVRILQHSEERYCCKLEYLMAEISTNVSSNLLLSVVYRPPHCGYLSEVFNIFADISALYKHSIIFGDFNADLDSHSYDAQLIKSFVSSMHFTLVPYAPTHYTRTSFTRLDLCIIDDADKLFSSTRC